jgi:hypothetical protein
MMMDALPGIRRNIGYSEFVFRLSYLRMLGWSAIGGIVAGYYFISWPRYYGQDGHFEYWGWPVFCVIWELRPDGSRIDFPNPLDIFLNPIAWFIMISVPGAVISAIVNFSQWIRHKTKSRSNEMQNEGNFPEDIRSEF